MSNYGGMPEKQTPQRQRTIYVERQQPQRSNFLGTLMALIVFAVLVIVAIKMYVGMKAQEALKHDAERLARDLDKAARTLR